MAERLSCLMAAAQKQDLAALAARLHVDELSLRMSIDDLSPHPTIEVLLAVIREYGVDPTWLVTGVYDPGSHRAAMEGDGLASALRDFTESQPGPISELPAEQFRATVPSDLRA